MGDWDQRTRQGKLASILYPNLASQTTQAEMQAIAKNETKQPPKASALLDHRTRGAVSPLGGVKR